MKKLLKHQKIFLFAVLIVACVSLFDIFSLFSGNFGLPGEYLVGDFGVTDWWSLFFKFNMVLIALISFSYYWFGKQDFSESISLFVSSVSLWLFFGLADLLFFVFRGVKVPEVLFWLNNGYIGSLASFIGFSEVTSTSLYFCVGIGLVVVYYANKIFVEKF